MEKRLFVCAALLASCVAAAYKPAEERAFSDIAATGCRNRDGEFIVRGLVSTATEDTVVLSDPEDEASTVPIALPGRGPFARAKGVFGKNKYEAAQQRLEQLRAERVPVVVTLQCRGNGTPAARAISYTNEDGSQGSITF